MKRASLLSVFLFLTGALTLSQSPVLLSNSNASVASPASRSQADPKAQARINEQYGNLPLSFEANHGQTDSRVKFLSRTSGYTLFLTGDEAVLALSGSQAKKGTASAMLPGTQKTPAVAHEGVTPVLRMKLRNANAAAKVTGVDELAGTSNYFIGDDPTKWRTNVPTYAKVKYEGVYSGIDLVYYGNQRQLEYDFIVAPGADPRRIALDIRGAKRIRRDEHGELVFKVGEGKIRWHQPVVYQEKDGARQEIAAHYAITDANRVTFELAKYDASRPLYIDPLIYSTLLGGNGTDYGAGIAVDSAGNAYVTGFTGSLDFPTMTPPQPMKAGAYDAFVSKINPSGSALVYSTYLGGSGFDYGYGIAVDSNGNAYVTGLTQSPNFPTTPGAFQTVCGDPSCSQGDAFVTKLNPAGSALVYSTYLGGNGGENFLGAAGIAVDINGNAYVTGATDSTNFPTMNPLQPYGGGDDAFVAKINPTGSALVYSTYLGGSNVDAGYGIALDSTGNAYVTGLTQSTNFPTMNPLQGSNPGSVAFVSKINSLGSALVYSTYLGGSGSGNRGFGIAVDSKGSAYITGPTYSNFPTTLGAFQTSFGGVVDAFVAKINRTGSALVYSTYLGGSGYEDNYGGGITVDSEGNAYVTGDTTSPDFPTMNPLQPVDAGSPNAFVTKINPTGSALVYSTYLGGSSFDHGTAIAMDSSGNAYVTGYAGSNDFPTMNPLQPWNAGGGDTFVTKINPTPSDVMIFPLHLDFGRQPVGIASGQQVSTLTNTGTDTLTITSISVIGASQGDFAQTNNCGTSVMPGTSCSITVTFTPAASGNRSAAVNITDSAPGSPQTVDLTGFGLSDTATKLTSSANPSAVGESVTFKAIVSSPQGGTPTGYVSFLDGATTLASKRLSGAAAQFATKKLPLGLNIITAVYGGDSNYAQSTSAPVNQHVLEAATTTTLTSSPNPSAYGQTVLFTATVTSKIGAPPDGETVAFMEGTTVLGTGILSSGTATFSTSTLRAGTDSITAVYAGDSNFVGSKSKPVKQVVNKAEQ